MTRDTGGEPHGTSMQFQLPSPLELGLCLAGALPGVHQDADSDGRSGVAESCGDTLDIEAVSDDVHGPKSRDAEHRHDLIVGRRSGEETSLRALVG